MRSSWNGVLKVGLLAIPVKLYRATEDNEYALTQIHKTDGGKIQYVRECTVCAETVPYEDVGKGKEIGGQMFPLTDQELEKLTGVNDKTIKVDLFIQPHEVDLTAFGDAYYIEPEKVSVRIYTLLRQQVKASARVGVAVFAMRSKDTLAILRADGKMLILQRVAWPQDIREPAFNFLAEEVHVTDRERQLATQLIDTMTGPWQPENYRSSYGDAMNKLLAGKLEENPPPEPPAPAQEAAVKDVGAVLTASIEAAKKRKDPAA